MSLFSFGGAAIPRAVPYNRWLWVGMTIWLVVTFSALGFGSWASWKNHLFADHARHVTGKVSQKYVTTSQSKHGTTSHYHVAYSYRAGDSIFNAVDTLQYEIWTPLSEGGPIPVKYLPEDPKDNRIDNLAVDFTYDSEAKSGLGMGLASLVVGSIWAIRNMRKNGLWRRLVESGLSCEGRVTSLETERVGKQTMLFVRFEFTDNFGREVQGRTWPIRLNRRSDWEARKSIPVFYDSQNSSLFTVKMDS